MGWGHCGEDSQGRPIGYAFAAVCDHPGCRRPIHRGLDYACGDMHGEDEISCERYFCHHHRSNVVQLDSKLYSVCDGCAQALLDSGEWAMDADAGLIRREEA